jgi:hypothetical protein
MSAETKQQARQALNLVLSDIDGMEDPGVAILYVDEASDAASAPISIAMGGMSVASALACIAMIMASVRGVASRASEKPNDNGEAESLGDALGFARRGP